MTAFGPEALRKITAENLQGDSALLTPYTSHINRRMTEAASLGRNSIMDPFTHFDGANGCERWPPPEIQKALRRHFIAAGFEVVDHPDPDPGHPASRAYTTLSW